MSDFQRCRSTITLGWPLPKDLAATPGLHTRCHLDNDGHDRHEGKGLAEFDFQRWTWFSGDRRTYNCARTDDRAWEIL
jgi:hypothetical protein